MYVPRQTPHRLIRNECHLRECRYGTRLHSLGANLLRDGWDGRTGIPSASLWKISAGLTALDAPQDPNRPALQYALLTLVAID